MSNALMRRWFDEVWNKRDESAIDEMMAENCDIEGLHHPGGEPVPAREAFKKFHRAILSEFSTFKITVQSSTENADGTTTAQCLVEGTHKASGKPVTFDGHAKIRVTDGQVSWAENKFAVDEIAKQTA